MKRRHDKLVVWRKWDVDGYLSGWTYFWHLKSAYNGKILCAGEPNGYSSKAKALKGWESVCKAVKNGVDVVEV